MDSKGNNRTRIGGKLLAASASVLALGVATGIPSAYAQDEAASEDSEDVIVVTGFRRSLAAALDVKREATGSVDAIVAEDIADFPDLNLAESLQRIPGVAITRDDGEGRNITVRGLSGQYTRIRINGMETRASVDAGNTGRNFDFNMFASELFNDIVVRKTASADVDEGSLAATVDLNTARAFNYEKGSTFLLGGQGQYNDLSEETMPRLTGLFAYHDPEGIWGVTGSIAYSETNTNTATGNTVRWQKAEFNSVLGVDCDANPTDAGCLEVADSFHARIPRYGESEFTRERLGLTAGFQYQPTDQTLLTVDGMFATFDQEQTFKTIEVLFRGNEGGMDVTDYVIEQNPGTRGGGSNNTLIAMDVDNAWVRSETYNQNLENEFYQLTGSLSHDFTDTLSVDVNLGTSRSEGFQPNATTLMYDDRDYDGYTYDYRDSTETPSLIFGGPDVTDGTNFSLTEVRDQVRETVSTFDNAELNVHWEFNPALNFSGGVSYKKFELETERTRRDGGVCGLGIFDCDTDDDGTDDLIGAPGTAALSELFTYPGDVGAGTTTTWAAPSLAGWTSALGVYDIPLREDQGNTRNIEEENLGVWIKASGELNPGNMRLLYDAGVRYVETEQTSSGFNSGVWVTIDRPKYDDTLPSANVALWVTDDLVLRASAAEVLSRPALSQLSPGGSVDSFNFGVNFQNPFLDPTRATAWDLSAEWYFADEAVLSLAVFNREIDSFPLRETREGTFASTGLPLSVISPTSPASQTLEGPPSESCNPSNGGVGCWEISELNNGPGADITGFEVGIQAPFASLFDDLPPILDGMGFQANYTYVDSDTTYNFSGTEVSERLIGLSNDSYNATLYYENDVFGARISAASRSDYLQSGPNRSGNLWQFVQDSTYVDFSSRYSVTDQLDVTFEVLNLTDEPFDNLVDVDANRRLQYDHTGRNFLLGARYKFQ